MAESNDHREKTSSAGIPTQAIRELTEGVYRLERRYSMWIAFRNGIMAGVGSTLGVFLVLSLLFWLLGLFDFIPAAGDLRDVIGRYLNENQS